MDNRANNSSMMAGIILIVLGLIFFAVTQGALNSSWGTIWPVFPILGGAIVLFQAFNAPNATARAGLVLGGAIPLLVGIFFFTITLGLFSWSDMGALWPVFPLIVGVAFWAAYFVSGFRQRAYAIPAIVLTLVGVVFLAITLTSVGYGVLGKLWPIFLIIAGVLLLTQRFWKTRLE
ncbi:MAG: DUF5668 domain-containing protein [Chloroflexota bacterium]